MRRDVRGRRNAGDACDVGLQIGGGARDAGPVGGIDVDGGGFRDCTMGKLPRAPGFDVARLAEGEGRAGQENGEQEACVSFLRLSAALNDGVEGRLGFAVAIEQQRIVGAAANRKVVEPGIAIGDAPEGDPRRWCRGA